jgi:hypothetical protein
MLIERQARISGGQAERTEAYATVITGRQRMSGDAPGHANCIAPLNVSG